MSARNKTAMVLAIVAGALLLVSGANGTAFWSAIGDFVNEKIGDNTVLHYVFVVLITLALLGGVMVIIGGLLMGAGRATGGKVLVGMGIGFGFIGLVASLYVGVMSGDPKFLPLLSVGAFGLILSIAAFVMARKETKGGSGGKK